MARKRAETTETPLLKEAKDRFKLALDAWSDNRKAWLEDAKFLAGDQWPENVKKNRQVPGKERPMLVVDKLGQYVRQVVNDGRQNRPSVKVRPIDGDGDPEVAEAFQGIVRHIWDKSNADQAADTALEHAVKGGFGFIRLTTDYAYENTFEQEICIKRIRNPLCVLLDPNIQEADGSDARFGFVIDEIPQDQFKARYPNAKFADWEYDKKKYSDDWLTNENVRIVEYFYKVDVPKTLLLLVDGSSVLKDDYDHETQEEQEINPQYQPPAIEDQREITSCEVKWARLTGAEILEENEWLGKYIPIIPVFGNEEDIDGKVIYSGLIRKAKDAQRLYNFSRSAFAERVALTPKAPYIGADEAVADFIDDWEEANTANLAILRYKHRDEQGNEIPPPSRQQPTDIPAGFSQDAQMSEHDIQAALGMYNANLGERSNETSGKAINARKSEGDMATFHFQDNQSRAIGYLGVQLIDLIPKIWDSRRAVRLLGEDGKSTAAMVDPQQQMPSMKQKDPMTGEAVTIYNLNAGKYDVSVAAGPSYTTKRQEAVEAMMQLTQSAPQFLQVAGDIMVRNMDWPGAQEIADRLKKMLPPQLQDQADDLPPEIQNAMQQIQQGQQQLQQGHAQLMQMSQELAQEKAMTDAQKVKLESLAKELDGKDKILQANYQELSAKLELQAMKAAQVVPQVMPPGKDEPAISPDQTQQPPSGGFFTPGANP